MKLNNKGYMLVEIIVSSAIALVMAYFLIDITLTLVNKNNDYYVESTLLSDKNLITKELMDDFNNNDYLLTDIVVGDDTKSATLTFKDLSVSEGEDNDLTKKFEINDSNNEIKYGSYTKKLSSDLNIKYINVTKDDTLKQLYISIPAYTNYSDIDYGINIVIPYTEDINVEMPEIKFNVKLTVVNGSISNNSLDVTMGNDAIFEGITPSSGYSLVKESDTCNGTLNSNGNYTIKNITDEKECTLTLKVNNLDTSGANSPDLVDGLIPVMHNGSSWVVADYTNSDSQYQWYDYNNKKWANAVLVTESKRNSLSKDSDGSYTKGQIIGDSYDDGTLAFYVWIPRYKYKVWNINKVVGTDSYDAYNTGIDIVFENEKESTGTITCEYNFNIDSDNGGINIETTTAESCTGSNGDYYTHPAFTFGSDEVRGFWVGKFEVSSSDSTNKYGGGNTTDLTVRVLPNVISWKFIKISYQIVVLENMQIEGNIYGLSTSRTTNDSHMLTNMEWGAISYLTNSKYGRCSNNSCKEVSLNGYGEDSNLTTMTGCGPISSGSTSYSTTCNKYNTTLGMTASTTGNITGVYDMNGGAEEYVMGSVSSVKGNFTFHPGDSDFSSDWYTDTTSKYITTYAYGNNNNRINQSGYNRGRLGDATAEIVLAADVTGGWYGDWTFFPDYSYPWFQRGGYFGGNADSGVFSFNSYLGRRDRILSSRAALVSLK